MSSEKKCWIIKSNKNKFVSDSRYNKQEVLKFSWSTDPSEAKIYTEYPVDCPSNSRVFELVSDYFYKIEIKDSQLEIVKSPLKPFSSEDEFRFKQDAIKNFISKNKKRITILQDKIDELIKYNEISSKLLENEKELTFESNNPHFDAFRAKCQNKVLCFTVMLWGTKYIDVLGKTITDEDSVTFCNSDGVQVIQIEKFSVVEFNHVEAEIYNVHVKPRHDQTFVLEFRLL